MRVLRFMWRIWRWLWRSGAASPDGIDGHKWESKVEILKNLSSRR
ncbi:MAG: hypothetical protein ACYTEK_26255 [Planctomycetota bacterium]